MVLGGNMIDAIEGLQKTQNDRSHFVSLMKLVILTDFHETREVAPTMFCLD